LASGAGRHRLSSRSPRSPRFSGSVGQRHTKPFGWATSPPYGLDDESWFRQLGSLGRSGYPSTALNVRRPSPDPGRSGGTDGGHSLAVTAATEHHDSAPSKLAMRVRFPSPAPAIRPAREVIRQTPETFSVDVRAISRHSRHSQTRSGARHSVQRRPLVAAPDSWSGPRRGHDAPQGRSRDDRSLAHAVRA
jgi:hypothetical protein